MSEYPEHDRIRALEGHNQTAGEFLDWIRNTKGLSLCLWYEEDKEIDEPAGYHPTNQGTESLLYEFFEIDRDKLEEEKRHMLTSLRETQV